MDKNKIIFEEAQIGIITIDKQGIIDSFNPEMLKLSGAKNIEEVIGLNLLTLPTYQEVGLTEHIKEGLLGKSFFIPVIKYVSFTGSKLSYRSYKGIPLKNENGEVEQLLLLILDVTEKVQIEEAKDSVYKQEEELQKINSFMVGRELKMIELKKEIEKLQKLNN